MATKRVTLNRDLQRSVQGVVADQASPNAVDVAALVDADTVVLFYDDTAISGDVLQDIMRAVPVWHQQASGGTPETAPAALADAIV